MQRLLPFVVEELNHGEYDKADTERRTDHRAPMSGVGGAVGI